MSMSVTLTPLGFVVVDEDNCLMPRMQPGHVIVFAGRFRAQALAAAIDSEDMTAAHALIAEHGRHCAYAA